MPCYRCGTRQTDPEAGKSSPWRRGVVGEHQVLICPGCAAVALADLARCGRCGSAHLVKRLDQVECLDCRLVRDAEPQAWDVPQQATQAGGAACGTELAAEVARALERVLGRRLGHQSPRWGSRRTGLTRHPRVGPVPLRYVGHCAGSGGTALARAMSA